MAILKGHSILEIEIVTSSNIGVNRFADDMMPLKIELILLSVTLAGLSWLKRAHSSGLAAHLNGLLCVGFLLIAEPGVAAGTKPAGLVMRHILDYNQYPDENVFRF